ncbi:DUF1828 domain-containing protein [Flammeovirga sp. MY04]|uniref:DUF1828 domain-containing protein n=1 Tax=Flammeovirga sp. MY04 TaxID=1191459 RepID=UPI0008060857|nr:DUF1828 domain-containing protein [Flammeovirga sp. MY04]ANQ51427.1 DUF1828 domain-containing protein [Flammeovirga sp. MY04]
MNDLNLLVNDYYSWLQDNTRTLKEKNSEWGRISTPYKALNNDFITFSIKSDKDQITISDDGDTINNLNLLGLEFNKRSKTRLVLKNKILKSYNIIDDEGELLSSFDKEFFPQKAHDFLQAIKELNDLSVLVKNNVTSLFLDDVRSYLDSKDVVYSEDIYLKSKDGLSIKYDFLIPRKKQDILISSFGKFHEGFLKQFIYDAENVSRVRRKECKTIAFLNDQRFKINKSILQSFDKIDTIDYVLWSERESEKSLSILTA